MNNSFNVMQLVQNLQHSANPQQMMMQYARQNPAIQRAMQIINGKSPEQIYGIAQQMAQQYGQNLNQLAQQLGVRLPK